MHAPFPLFIALRFIRSKSKGNFLSFTTWISILGLILGVATLIVVTSVLNGFEKVVTERILGMVPQATILSHSELEDWQDYARQIKLNNPDVLGVAPFSHTRGMTSINGDVLATIVNGIDPSFQAEVSILPKVMIAGTLESLQAGRYNIILGKNLVDKRHLKLGDEISIILAKPDRSAIGINTQFYSFTLSGVFSVSEEVDSWMSYVNIQDAAAILNKPKAPNGLRLKVSNVLEVDNSLKKAGDVLAKDGIKYVTNTWQSSHKSLYDSIKRQKWIMSLFLCLIIIVAAFNIVSTLVMVTTEKKSEIAILQTIGASKKTIIMIFFNQGVLISAIGVLIGTATGLFLASIIEVSSRWINAVFNLGLFDTYYVTGLPAYIDMFEIMLIAIISLVLCVLASIYPSIKAANNSPINSL